MDMAKTGALIAARRKALNLTQEELGKRLEVTDKAVSKWERGLSCPDIALLGRLAVFGKIEGAISLDLLFRGPYMSRMLPALGNPTGVGPVSLAFAWVSKLAGGLLFGQYEFCGIALAWCMTIASLFLVQKRIGKLADGQRARDAAFLLLCLPGSVFFLLPGWAPIALLGCAIAFSLLGKRLHGWKIRLSPVAWGWILTILAVLSAAVTVCAAEGRLG